MRSIRVKYGNVIRIIEVTTPENISNNPLSDYLLVDSSFKGGTGKGYNIEEVLKSIPSSDIQLFIAGGVTDEFVKSNQGKDLIFGFDVQSFVHDNKELELGKLRKLARSMGKEMLRQSYGIGYATECNDKYFKNGEYDFLHVDLFDRQYRPNSSLKETFAWLKNMQSLVNVDFHVLTESKTQLDEIQVQLGVFGVEPEQVFYHINLETLSLYKDNLRSIP